MFICLAVLKNISVIHGWQSPALTDKTEASTLSWCRSSVPCACLCEKWRLNDWWMYFESRVIFKFRSCFFFFYSCINWKYVVFSPIHFVCVLFPLQGLYITPDHYADIVEERAIINTCGYPVCSNALGTVSYPPSCPSVDSGSHWRLTLNWRYIII